MKNSRQVIILTGLLIISSCQFSEGPDHPYKEIQNLCIINSDGSSYSVIAQEYYATTEKYLVNNDSQILLAGYEEFILMNIDGSNIIQIPVSMDLLNTCISHDRSKIAFIGQKNSEQDIFIMDWNGSNLKKVTNTPSVAKRNPSFSFDGSKIVYILIYSSQTQILPSLEIVDIISDETKVVLEDTNHASKSSSPYWYPCFGKDNDIIFYIYEYWSYEKNIYEDALYSINVSGINNKIVENDVSRLGNIATTSHSQKIVFLGSGDPIHIFITDYNGLNKIDLGITPIGTFINISDDGTKIVYGNEQATYDDNIVIINSDGTDRKILIKGGSPVFSSDASRVLFIKKEIIVD